MTDPAYGYNPVSAFQQEAQAFSQSPNSLQGILGSLEGAAAPQQALSQLQAALAGNQYNLAGQQLGLTDTNLEQQAAYQLAQGGINMQQIGLQGQGLAAQAGLLGTTSQAEQYEAGLQAQQYPEQLAEAALNYGANKQSLQGNLAASGATNTVGAKTQQNLLDKNYQYQQADINRAGKEAFTQQVATLAQQKYSAGDIARQQQNLQLVAESNGLSMQEVQQQLGYGLAQSGLDYQEALPQLLGSLSSIYAGELGTAEGAAGEAGLLSGSALGNVQQHSGLNLYSPGVLGLG